MKKIYLLLLLTSFIGFSQNPGDLVITEYLNDSDAVSDTVGEWFEIFNTTNNAIDLNGWTINDDGSNTFTFTTSVVVPANSYFVLGRGPADPTQNGGVNLDFSYGDGVYTLGNGADEIVLLSPSSVEIDRVNYGSGNGFPDEGPGISLILDPTLSIASADNNDGNNWCFSSSAFGDGDLGTPGAANDGCTAVCEANLGTSTADCDSISPGSDDDTYTVSLDYFGAATGETFVVTTTPSGFTIGGDDPTSVADGTITVSGVTEGTDITISVSNTAAGGLCDLTRDVTSPVCLPTGSVDLELVGVIDFTVPEGGSSGKAIHVVATADIADLSEYGLGSANNGGGTDGQEYTFPMQSVSNGDHILLVRDLAAMENYLTTPGFNLWNLVLEDTNGDAANGNGNDAVELFKNGAVVETFGDINDGNSAAGGWNYVDSWAYKNVPGSTWPNGWIYGGADCTDGTNTTFDSTCVYPFVASLSNEEFGIEGLKIYPNPVRNGIVYITSNLDSEIQVEVYDMLGRSVLSSKLTNDRLNLSSLDRGVYLVKVISENKSTTRKIIVE